MRPWMWELWVLAFWWSTWTLADKYLIPFTPVSELVLLGVCGVTLLFSATKGRRTEIVRKIDAQLTAVTLTGTATQYDAQVDSV